MPYHSQSASTEGQRGCHQHRVLQRARPAARLPASNRVGTAGIWQAELLQQHVQEDDGDSIAPQSLLELGNVHTGKGGRPHRDDLEAAPSCLVF